jgi:flavin reductase (DIM6/NTAB) family NADH-FMN oxidoreductase RutF
MKAGPVPSSPSAAAGQVYSASSPHLTAVAPADAVEAVDAEMFRQAMGRHAAGVAIVTLRGPSGPAGLTVTSFSSASLDPPLVSFYIGHGSSSWPTVQLARHFAVNLMGHGQQELAARFARKGADRFGPATQWEAGPAGLPLLAGATVHMICATDSLVTIGDHELVVGRVVEASIGAGDIPLLHHRGQFTRPALAPHA